MSQLANLIRYREFATRCKTSFRFVRDADCEHFLNVLAQALLSRATSLASDMKLYRAQLGCCFEEIPIDEDGDTYESPVPFPLERMKPPLHGGREGRVNPKGMSVLYLSTDPETAVAEIRPYLRALVSVAVFIPRRELKLVDCSVEHGTCGFNLAFREEHGPTPDTIVAALDKAFAEPIYETDTSADYSPTQIVAEKIRALGFDGLIFKSSVGDGKNVALFDSALADPTHARVVVVDHIKYGISQAY